jgi:hypothetical protein
MTASLGRPVRLLLLAALAFGLLLAVPSPARGQASGCPSVGGNFGGTGPFAVTVQQDTAHTYYSPTVLGSNGCARHPVILWGNGTLTSPSFYDGLLRHFASHGFIVAAANTSNAGTGQEMLQGLDNLARFNGQAGHRFNNRVDTQWVGATGHSQGGAGAVRAAMDARVDTVFSIEGATTPTGVRGPAIFFAGQNDSLRTSVRAAYDAATAIPAAYAELAGAGHLEPLGDGGGFRGAATAWARWQLMGDTTARGQFVGANCGLCTSNAWSTYVANARLGDGGPSPEPGQCVSATNSAHVRAGRATGTLLISAVGSGDFLGFPSATTTLRQTAPGNWARVTAC